MTPPNTTGAQALSRAEVDSIVYACRQSGDDSTYAIVNAAIEALACREQAGAVACKRCHGSGSVEDGQITHHECGIPYENGPVQCMKDCPACNGAGKFFAAPGAALASREEAPAEKRCSDERPCTPCFIDKGACEEAPAASAVHEDANDEKRRLQSEYEQAIWDRGYEAGVNGTGRTAPEQSTAPNAELLRGWKRYEKLRKLTPAAFNRLHIVNVTGGNSFDDLVDALPEPSTPVPEQSAKGLTMGGEVDREA
jgi:hypothetical protein